MISGPELRFAILKNLVYKDHVINARYLYEPVKRDVRSLLVPADFEVLPSGEVSFEVKIRTELGRMQKEGLVYSPGRKGGWRITKKGRLDYQFRMVMASKIIVHIPRFMLEDEDGTSAA